MLLYQTMALRKLLKCTRQMTFGYSTGKTCDLILADKWFGYAESECFSTTNSLIRRILIALNCLMYFHLQSLRISRIPSNHSQYVQPSRRLSNTNIAWVLLTLPRLERRRQWWRCLTWIHHQSTWCQHRYHANAHGSRVLVSTTQSRKWCSSFEPSYDWHGTTVDEGRWHRARYTSTNIARKFLPEEKWPWILFNLCTLISMICLMIHVTAQLQNLRSRSNHCRRRSPLMIPSNHCRPSRRFWVRRGRVPDASTRMPNSCLRRINYFQTR